MWVKVVQMAVAVYVLVKVFQMSVKYIYTSISGLMCTPFVEMISCYNVK